MNYYGVDPGRRKNRSKGVSENFFRPSDRKALLRILFIFVCRLQTIATRRDDSVRLLSICLSAYVCPEVTFFW